jgi:NAD(P)-dependent dehydrogenase (short-subunit alcohol dehydrogenase family)
MWAYDAASRTMRETLRRKPTKDENTADVNSPSAESVATNPWADAQSGLEPVSRQTSKASQSPGPSILTNKSRSPGPALPDLSAQNPPPLVHDASQAPSEKPKRKKTAKRVSTASGIATTNGPVDLPIPAEEQTIAEDPKPNTSGPPNSSLNREAQPSRPRHSFCNLPPTISIEPVKAKSKAKNPFVPIHTRQSSSVSLPSAAVTTTRFIPPSFTSETHTDFFTGKIFVITNGASLIGASIVKLLHKLGARVILGDPDSDRAKRLIKTIGEPHLIHFNRCDTRNYEDMLDLFRLASTMYGRVDHAIFGVGDDGAATGSVGDGERGWFDRAAKPGIEGVEREPPGLIDTLAAAPRFAHIALAYLRDKPKKRNSTIAQDRSLTFLTSVAAFKETPFLPVYQTTQHGVLGLMRNLRSSINPETDGLRINAILTGVMVPRATSGVGGRMSVKLPSDMPEDVGRAVVGVVAAGMSEKTIVTRAGGRLHGRALYVVGGEGYDIEEGLDNSESLWLGPKAADHLRQAQEGIGKGSQWIMDLG